VTILDIVLLLIVLVAVLPWLPEADASDDGQTSVWERVATAPIIYQR
jgi:hypothetical protein